MHTQTKKKASMYICVYTYKHTNINMVLKVQHDLWYKKTSTHKSCSYYESIHTWPGSCDLPGSKLSFTSGLLFVTCLPFEWHFIFTSKTKTFVRSTV